jgi:hypothetical protein
MAAIPLNLTIEQGTDFEVTFTVRNKDSSPLNLLDYDVLSYLKKHYASTTHKQFNVSFLDRANGRISLSLSDTVTSTLKEGRYVYDVVLVSPNDKRSRVIQGMVTVSPGVVV